MSAQLPWTSISNLYSGNSYKSTVEAKYRQTYYRLEVSWSYDFQGRPTGRAILARLNQYYDPIEHMKDVVFSSSPLIEAQEWAEDFILTPMDRLTLGLTAR